MSNNSGSKQPSTTSRDHGNLRETVSMLRDKTNILEDELGTLKREQLTWDVERSILEKELWVRDDKLNELARELSLSKEAEAKAVKRFDKAMEYNRVVEEKFEGFVKGFDKERVELTEKLRGKEGELDGLVKEKEGFKAGLREKDERIGELVREREGFEAGLREKDGRIRELEKGEGESMKNMSDLFGQIEVLENDILEITSNRDRKIEELVKEKEGLEREKREIMEKYKMVEEKYVMLEAEVVTNLCLKTKSDEVFKGSMIGKILSGVMDALDVEQEHGVIVEEEVDIGGNSVEDISIDHVNSAHHSSDGEESSKTVVLSEDELEAENGTACDQKRLIPECIDISDSDDDEIPCHVSSRKRARASSVCSIQKHSNHSSSDGSLNPKDKIRKLEHVVAASDFRSENRVSTLHKPTAPTIKKCKEILSTSVTTPNLEGYDCKDVSRSNTTGVLEFMAKCQQKKAKKIVESVADMALACKKDPEFCAKAVCALYRNGLLCSGQRVLNKCDIDRGIVLAKYLVDGDPKSDKKKSMNELEQRHPRALDTCKKLAFGYCDKLFEIYKSDKDPLFSHLSPDVQYR